MKKNTTLRKRVNRSTPRVSSLLTAISTPVATPNVAYNEKGALSFATTTSAVLDWFSSGGAMRQEPEDVIQNVFSRAFAEDRLLATKVAFHHRDIRGGSGQRRPFRVLLRWLAFNYPDVVRKNIALIPEYGRWDDIFVLFGSPLQAEAVYLIDCQLKADLRDLKKGNSISLLGKWMPSENTSSQKTRSIANFLRHSLRLSPKKYRQLLSTLRKKVEVVERRMCARDWTNIDYSHVSSRALMRYRKAFPKHDPVGYAQWKGKAFSGEVKVNAGALYPYDIVTKVMRSNWDETLELQWRNLPDFFEGEIHNALVVCDTSGSMKSWNYNSAGTIPTFTAARPLDVALSLSLYMAERMNGPFKNHFITFDAVPTLQVITGNSLDQKVKSLREINCMNTNIQAVFNLILEKAKQSHLQQSEMPDAIYIISDLQFDACGFDQRNFDVIKANYKACGYKMPLLVFWQVRYTSDKVALKNEKGVVMISGFSPNILKSVLKLENPKEVTPMDLMLATINGPRYEAIIV